MRLRMFLIASVSWFVLVGSSAQASLPVVGMQPPISSSGIGPLEAIEDLPHLNIEASFWLDSSHHILKVNQTMGSNTNDLGYLISYRLAGLLQTSMGLYDWVTISFGLPVIYHQGSDLNRTILGVDLVEPGSGVGDITLNVHRKIFDEKDAYVDLALLMPMTLPTSNQGSYAGEAGVSITPTVVAAKSLVIGGGDNPGHVLRLHGELGYQIRKKYELEGMLFNDQIHYTLGASASLEPWTGFAVSGFAAWVGSVVLEKGSYGDHIYPQEFQAGGTWNLPAQWIEPLAAVTSMTRITFGFGMGLGASPVTPSGRIFVGVEGSHQIKFDSDGDGVEDDADGCPDVPEDLDGVGDQDGCPEDDYDSDGVLDVDDKCPGKPETANDFQDEDGCPDERLDSDKDQVFDDLDKCIEEPEDIDGFEDQDGCPDLDNDQDGILDAGDKCGLEAEDIDEFEDEDGCPDLDNDQDGIEDDKDKCPVEAEDIDEFEDEDGCPDLDNDLDGVLDSVDKCPLEPEAPPEEGERDGCPDVIVQDEAALEGSGPEDKKSIALGDTLTQFAKDVQFAHATKTPTPKSNTAIGEIIRFLKDHPEIQKILITGHTDSVGLPKRNLFLSKRRADILKDRLIAGGISASRISTEGKGASEPVATNATQQGRGQNRRIVITVSDLDRAAGSTVE